VKFELDGQVRACCILKPITYSDLLKSIKSLFGDSILNSLENIRCVFSRDDALRLLITNDDDLNKVIAIAEANHATKLNFLLTQTKGLNSSQIKPKFSRDDSSSLSDDAPEAKIDDHNSDSPPPGTIAPHKRRTKMNATSKSTTSNDGGLFIPESVRFFSRKRYYLKILVFFDRVMKFIPVVDHQ
jgi:hypothetical protein